MGVINSGGGGAAVVLPSGQWEEVYSGGITLTTGIVIEEAGVLNTGTHEYKVFMDTNAVAGANYDVNFYIRARFSGADINGFYEYNSFLRSHSDSGSGINDPHASLVNTGNREEGIFGKAYYRTSSSAAAARCELDIQLTDGHLTWSSAGSSLNQTTNHMSTFHSVGKAQSSRYADGFRLFGNIGVGAAFRIYKRIG